MVNGLNKTWFLSYLSEVVSLNWRNFQFRRFNYFIYLFICLFVFERTGLTRYRLKPMGTFNTSSLDKEQLGSIHGHFWKERLKLRKPIKFKGDTQ